MRAAVYRAPGAPLELTTIPDPVAGPGDIVVRVKDSGVCGSDLHAARSTKVRMAPGTVMGHELAGIVEEVGAGVEGFTRGDAVAAMSYLACGDCAMCRAGVGVRCLASKLVGFGEAPGGFAEFIKTRPGSLFKLPEGMSLRAAATVEPMVVGLHGLRRVRFQLGESCLILGAGSIGSVALLWARSAGASTVVVSEVSLERRELALKLGADAAVDPRMRNPANEMMRLTGAGPDVVLECIGEAGTLAQAINYAPRGGKVGVLTASMEDDGFAPGSAMSRELDIYFSAGVEPGEVEATITAIAARRIDAEALISHVIGLDDLPQAFAALGEGGPAGKLMIEF